MLQLQQQKPTTMSIKLTLTFNDGIIIFVFAHHQQQQQHINRATCCRYLSIHLSMHAYTNTQNNFQLYYLLAWKNSIVIDITDGLSILNLPLLHWYVYWHVYRVLFQCLSCIIYVDSARKIAVSRLICSAGVCTCTLYVFAYAQCINMYIYVSHYIEWEVQTTTTKTREEKEHFCPPSDLDLVELPGCRSRARTLKRFSYCIFSIYSRSCIAFSMLF